MVIRYREKSKTVSLKYVQKEPYGVIVVNEHEIINVRKVSVESWFSAGIAPRQK